jgi:peroxiredoxin
MLTVLLVAAMIVTIAADGQASTSPKGAAREPPQRSPQSEPVRSGAPPLPIMLNGAAAERFRAALSVEDPAEKLRLLRKVEPLVTDEVQKSTVLYPALVEASVAVGNVESAAKLVEQMAAAKVPTLTEANARVSLARGYMAAKQYGLAAEQLNPTVTMLTKGVQAKAPPNAKYMQSLISSLALQGETFVEQGDSQKALDALSESERLRESSRMTRSARLVTNIARADAKLGNQDQALQAFAEAYCMTARQVNAINRHAEVVGRAAAESYLKELPEQENLLTWIKTEARPVYGPRERQKPFDSFLSEKLEEYDGAQISSAVRKSATNKPAPNFSLSTLTGSKVKLSDLRGKVILLNFWDTACKPCRAEYPHLLRIQNEFKDQGVSVLMINLNTETDSVKPFAEKNGFTQAVLLTDGVIQRAYEVGTIPNTAIIDKSGIIRFNETGFTLDTPDVFRAVITSLLTRSETEGPALSK